MKTEVEIRSFLTLGQYLRLLKFFRKQNKNYFQDTQETIYFSGKNDLRIQKNKKYSKIWFKSGKIHQSIRKEFEIIVPRSDFNKLLELFLALGYKVDIKWFRKRSEFKWKGIKVFLDYTKGYGYIIELEKLTTKKDHHAILKDLKTKLKKLNILQTSKKEFDQKFNYYKKHWRKLVGG